MPLTHKENVLVELKDIIKKISHKIYQEEPTIIIFLVILGGIALNLKKQSQLFQVSIHDHSCHPLQQTTGNSFNG